MTTELRLASRASALAMVQTERVVELLESRLDGVRVVIVPVASSGDRDRASPVARLTQVGAFVRALQEAVLDGRADAAVHSCKDLPVAGPPDLSIAAYPERESPNDVLVGADLDELPPGARVGTGSPRRAAQLHTLRPDVLTVELRGNVDTRLRKVTEGRVSAAVMAEAGLRRLGRGSSIARRFSIDEMVPAPAQGALAVEAVAGSEAAELVALVDDPQVRRLVESERLLLAATGAGCRAALGALAEPAGDRMRLTAFVKDGRGPRRSRVEADEASALVDGTRAKLGL